MTDIDRTADIDVSRDPAWVTVRIPLTGHVSELWLAGSWGLGSHVGASRRVRPAARPGRPYQSARHT